MPVYVTRCQVCWQQETEPRHICSHVCLFVSSVFANVSRDICKIPSFFSSSLYRKLDPGDSGFVTRYSHPPLPQLAHAEGGRGEKRDAWCLFGSFANGQQRVPSVLHSLCLHPSASAFAQRGVHPILGRFGTADSRFSHPGVPSAEAANPVVPHKSTRAAPTTP